MSAPGPFIEEPTCLGHCLHRALVIFAPRPFMGVRNVDAKAGKGGVFHNHVYSCWEWVRAIPCLIPLAVPRSIGFPMDIICGYTEDVFGDRPWPCEP
eukprot:45775-Amorphochlora_amoeboformis.AAC.1